MANAAIQKAVLRKYADSDWVVGYSEVVPSNFRFARYLGVVEFMYVDFKQFASDMPT